MSFTPGPWTTYAGDKVNIGGGLYLESNGRTMGERIYNAKLIAAAPELLALLEEAEAHLEWIGWGDSYERSAVFEDKLPERIQAAIAKALGGRVNERKKRIHLYSVRHSLPVLYGD